MVLGLGASGEVAARLLSAEGVDVVAMDKSSTSALCERKDALSKRGIQVRLGDEAAVVPPADLCVVSPGVPTDSEWVSAVRSGHCPTISELSLAAMRLACPVLAVTGSNGKSTMVKLCVDAFRADGKKAAMAGNCMPPLAEVVEESRRLDWVVVEVSSFQMEHPGRFHPDVAVLLNIVPNHLDRHGSMQEYTRLKSRLFARQRPSDTAVVFAPNADAMKSASKGRGRWITFGGETSDIVYAEGRVIDRRQTPPLSIDVSGSYFDNPVLGLTVCAALAALQACGVSPRALERAIREFHPLAHRIETVRTVRGVRFVDDSKATNLAAMCAAVRMMGGRVRLIAGGLLKETDCDCAKEVLAKYVKTVYLIGVASGTLYAAWRNTVDCRLCDTLERAVQEAFGDSAPGDVVLLSPGGASFDQFRSFAHRGETFRKRVEAIDE